MNEMKSETANENWSQSASEVAKHSSLSFSLSGWPGSGNADFYTSFSCLSLCNQGICTRHKKQPHNRS